MQLGEVKRGLLLKLRMGALELRLYREDLCHERLPLQQKRGSLLLYIGALGDHA